jgi:dTDP-4-amino-4,6-dideoxygalactose transaminase
MAGQDTRVHSGGEPNAGLLAGLHRQQVVLPGAVPSFENYLPFGKPDFSAEEIHAVTRVLRSGWIGMGPETIAFEEELAEYFGAPHVVTVNSCTSALFLALLVEGIHEGDEVICPSLTWCATANAALYLGARPVFCDVDPDTLCITPETVRARLTSYTRAVMAVHLGGFAVDVDAIRRVLPAGVAVIEDAAHALGSRFSSGKAVGGSGNPTCFSFYANKNLSTGDGGAIALFDSAQAERLRSLRQNGMPANAWNRFTQPASILHSSPAELGYKMNFIDLQAAIGRVQLRRQPEFQTLRAEIARIYFEELSALYPDLGFQRGVLDPGHARHLFTVSLPLNRMKLSRDEFLLELRAHNVGASIHYSPLHAVPLYGSRSQRLTNTERIANSILTLPMSSSMNLVDARQVAEIFQEVFYRAVR